MEDKRIQKGAYVLWRTNTLYVHAVRQPAMNAATVMNLYVGNTPAAVAGGVKQIASATCCGGLRICLCSVTSGRHHENQRVKRWHVTAARNS